MCHLARRRRCYVMKTATPRKRAASPDPSTPRRRGATAQSGTLIVPFAVVIVFAAAGVAAIFGTLAAVIAGADPAAPPRGVARITWLGGKAALLFRRAHMRSMPLTK